MTIGEVLLCLVALGAVCWPIYLWIKAKSASRLGTSLMFLPGFIAANLVSLLVSRPGDSLLQSSVPALTDQPTFVGFPLSFYELGAWGDNRFHVLAFITNLAIAIVPGAILAGYLLGMTDSKQLETMESSRAVEGEGT
jgi:hypothetical protein